MKEGQLGGADVVVTHSIRFQAVRQPTAGFLL